MRLLAARGKRILISSYTHSAVDNLLLKLVEDGVGCGSKSDLVRIGAKSSCHPSLQSFLAPEIACKFDRLEGKNSLSSKPSTSNLHRVISSAKIVGATALTVPKTPLLLGEHFDIVIVDEAGQISQPALLGSLMAADSFVLVGDHQQLPPLVQSEAAEKAGVYYSLLIFHFKMLRFDLSSITQLYDNILQVMEFQCLSALLKHSLMQWHSSLFNTGCTKTFAFFLIWWCTKDN